MDVEKYEKLAQEVLKKEVPPLQRFLAEMEPLIRKYAENNMSDDEIVSILNKLLTTEEIRKQFGIPLDKRQRVFRKHIRKITNAVRNEKKKKKQKITQPQPQAQAQAQSPSQSQKATIQKKVINISAPLIDD